MINSCKVTKLIYKTVLVGINLIPKTAFIGSSVIALKIYPPILYFFFRKTQCGVGDFHFYYPTILLYGYFTFPNCIPTIVGW